MLMKFKVGDRVASISKEYHPGKRGIIDLISSDSSNPNRTIYLVLLDGLKLERGFFEDELALISNGVNEMIKCL